MTKSRMTVTQLKSLSSNSDYRKRTSETGCSIGASHQMAQHHLRGSNNSFQIGVPAVRAEPALWKIQKARITIPSAINLRADPD